MGSEMDPNANTIEINGHVGVGRSDRTGCVASLSMGNITAHFTPQDAEIIGRRLLQLAATTPNGRDGGTVTIGSGVPVRR